MWGTLIAHVQADDGHDVELLGAPARGLTTATVGFFAGLTMIVFYGAAGPHFAEAFELSGWQLGALLSSPHISKAVLRVPFGAWVDSIGGRTPLLILLLLSLVGLAGVTSTLGLVDTEALDERYFPLFLVFGVIGGAGGATFSVGAAQTSYWFSLRRQGWALGVYAGVGNIGPGLFNLVIPALVAAIGIAGAYASWLIFMAIVASGYALWAVNPYFFQLTNRGVGSETARRIAASRGQEMFPTGSAWDSLKQAGRNPLTWALVFLYTISFGGGFTALTAWFPTYWYAFHGTSLVAAGALSALFTVYGSIMRVPGGILSDRIGGERVTVAGFLAMAVGGAILTLAHAEVLCILGMLVLATGMGAANAAIFKLVADYASGTVGGTSGLVGGFGGLGTLVVLPALGIFVDSYGTEGYALGFSIFIALSLTSAVGAGVLDWHRRRTAKISA